MHTGVHHNHSENSRWYHIQTDNCTEFQYNSGGYNAELWNCIWQTWLCAHLVVLRITLKAVL